MKDKLAISFEHVDKTYKLYKNDKQRFLGLFMKKRIKYKEYKALNDLSFEIKKGESVGVIGRNGAGKSTLLKMITGVCFADAGDVTVNGKVAALLELTAGFDIEMTGRENIYLRGYILGFSDEKIKSLEGAIIDFAEIGDFIDQPVRTYSSGMRARLGFAINVNVEPDILVIDEVLSVGDASFSAKCRKRVAELIASDVTVLFVSHTQKQVEQFCERALFLERGQILADGDVESVGRFYEEFVSSGGKAVFR